MNPQEAKDAKRLQQRREGSSIHKILKQKERHDELTVKNFQYQLNQIEGEVVKMADCFVFDSEQKKKEYIERNINMRLSSQMDLIFRRTIDSYSVELNRLNTRKRQREKKLGILKAKTCEENSLNIGILKRSIKDLVAEMEQLKNNKEELQKHQKNFKKGDTRPVDRHQIFNFFKNLQPRSAFPKNASSSADLSIATFSVASSSGECSLVSPPVTQPENSLVAGPSCDTNPNLHQEGYPQPMDEAATVVGARLSTHLSTWGRQDANPGCIPTDAQNRIKGHPSREMAQKDKVHGPFLLVQQDPNISGPNIFKQSASRQPAQAPQQQAAQQKEQSFNFVVEPEEDVGQFGTYRTHPAHPESGGRKRMTQTEESASSHPTPLVVENPFEKHVAQEAIYSSSAAESWTEKPFAQAFQPHHSRPQEREGSQAGKTQSTQSWWQHPDGGPVASQLQRFYDGRYDGRMEPQPSADVLQQAGQFGSSQAGQFGSWSQVQQQWGRPSAPQMGLSQIQETRPLQAHPDVWGRGLSMGASDASASWQPQVARTAQMGRFPSENMTHQQVQPQVSFEGHSSQRRWGKDSSRNFGNMSQMPIQGGNIHIHGNNQVNLFALSAPVHFGWGENTSPSQPQNFQFAQTSSSQTFVHATDNNPPSQIFSSEEDRVLEGVLDFQENAGQGTVFQTSAERTEIQDQGFRPSFHAQPLSSGKEGGSLNADSPLLASRKRKGALSKDDFGVFNLFRYIHER